MKIKTLLLTILLAVFAGTVLPRQAQAAGVTFSYFYENLQPYGDWVEVQDYGYCWHPRGMEKGWRPYTDGYWTYTDAGWTWMSYEEFGAITYHYGRWVNLEEIGWVWKPDYEWGPAWVAWRQSDDYVGWAPLPPEVELRPEVGIGVWVDRDYDIGPSSYVFCEYRHFGAPVIADFLLPIRRNYVIINSTVNITNITVINQPNHRHTVYNGGLDYRYAAERSQHRIEVLELVRQTDGDWSRLHRPRVVGNQLFIAAPELQVTTERFAPSNIARVINAPRIDRGWRGVSDNAERERIKQRYSEQTRGLTRTTTPVWPMDLVQSQLMLQTARARQQKDHAQQERMQAVESEQLRRLKKAQEAIAVQQRATAEMQIRAAQAQQQAQQLQETQRQAAKEQQRKAVEMQTRAVEVQQQQAQQLQAGQRQAAREQQRKAVEMQTRAVEAQQQQAQQLQEAQRQAAKEQQRQAAEMQARSAEAQGAQRQAREQQRNAAEAQMRAAQAQQRQAAEMQSRAAQQQQQQQQQTREQRQMRPPEARQPEQGSHHGKGNNASPSPTPTR